MLVGKKLFSWFVTDDKKKERKAKRRSCDNIRTVHDEIKTDPPLNMSEQFKY